MRVVTVFAITVKRIFLDHCQAWGTDNIADSLIEHKIAQDHDHDVIALVSVRKVLFLWMEVAIVIWVASKVVEGRSLLNPNGNV